MGAGASSAGKPQTVSVTPSRPTRPHDGDTPGTGTRSSAPPPTPIAPKRGGGKGTWQYASAVGSDDWTDATNDQNERLEEAYLNQKHRVEVAFGRFLYSVDLDAMRMQLASGGADWKPIQRNVAEAAPELTTPLRTAQTDSCVRISPAAAARGLSVELAASVKAHEGLVYCARFDAMGTKVLTGSRDGTLRLWELDTGFVTTNFDTINGVVLNCSLSMTKPLAVSGADDSVIRLYNTATSAPKAELLGHTHKVYGVDFSSDSKSIISGSMDNTTRLWDVVTGQQLHVFIAHTASVFTVVTSHYSPSLALSGGDDNLLISYDLRSRQPATVFRGHSQTIWACDVRFDEMQYASSGMDGTVLLWDPRLPSTPVAKCGNHCTPDRMPVPVHSVEFSPDGTKVITAARDNTWRLWDSVPSGPQAVELCSVEAHGGVVFCASFCAPRSQILSIGSDSTVRLWDTVLC